MNVAGTNEKRFIEQFESKIGTGILKGKRLFKKSKVSISVDNSLFDGSREVLIEIDSFNMAKVVVGQFVLLDHLYTGLNSNSHFLVIHTYENYSIKRTLNNLVLATVIYGLQMPYSALHIEDLEAWPGGSLGEFLSMAST